MQHLAPRSCRRRRWAESAPPHDATTPTAQPRLLTANRARRQKATHCCRVCMSTARCAPSAMDVLLSSVRNLVSIGLLNALSSACVAARSIVEQLPLIHQQSAQRVRAQRAKPSKVQAQHTCWQIYRILRLPRILALCERPVVGRRGQEGGGWPSCAPDRHRLYS